MQPSQDEHTEIPPLHLEPDEESVDGAQLPPEPSPKDRARRRRPAAEPDYAEEPPPSAAVDVTEAQLVRAFYWMYRGWCKLLGAQVEAHASEFQDLGKAWLDLARKVPGIRWVLAAVGPVFTLTDLVDKLARAWEARTRLRGPIRIPNWRNRDQQGAEQGTVVEPPAYATHPNQNQVGGG